MPSKKAEMVLINGSLHGDSENSNTLSLLQVAETELLRGQAVLANLMLTFSNLGCLIPPQAGMVFSRLGQEAKKHGAEWARDIWDRDDVGSICDKVMAYASQRNAVKAQSWPMDSDPDSFHRRWIEPPAEFCEQLRPFNLTSNRYLK